MPDETNEILQRLTRVETKLDMINSARDIGMEALQATRALQMRVEELRDEVEQLRNRQAEFQKWLIGIIISSGGLFIAAAGLMLRMMES
ncbi:hemolysin XhlA [Paenibacillus sp. YN15]|uniref:hemolysin XhlA n=1 Tax=Paenibacillus sp. YN15 TaxID=1742774 RepID=UPI000DCD0327|nr:hemolysin XhlA [Paenibacillus sp. YN15]RAV06461.1 hemolysin XhlA [Paenibacillus sp. YN15]